MRLLILYFYVAISFAHSINNVDEFLWYDGHYLRNLDDYARALSSITNPDEAKEFFFAWNAVEPVKGMGNARYLIEKMQMSEERRALFLPSIQTLEKAYYWYGENLGTHGTGIRSAMMKIDNPLDVRNLYFG